MAPRHTYSQDEIEEYFDRICIPHTSRVHDVSRSSAKQKLDFLNMLQKHHLCKVPWENLVQHYSWHKKVHVKPNHLFKKIVRQPGRGGYCMEVNYFFHLILYSLNFDVYMVGSRIWRSAGNGFGGWTHVVNIVTIDGQKYLLDGGYGGAGPPRPMRLMKDEIQTQIAPAQMRLLYEPIAENLNRDHKVWIYQQRYSEDDDWTNCYCFPDFEFIPSDIESMNFAPSLNPQTFFTHKLVTVRFSTTRELNGSQGPSTPNEAALSGEIDGSITLNHDVLKWRRRGQKVIEWPLKTEGERLQALEMYFGIVLDAEDTEGIVGTAAAIGAKAMVRD